MNKRFIPLLSALICVVICASLFGCDKSDYTDQSNAPIEEDTFVPVTDKGEGSELYERYSEYKENATLAFKNNAPAQPENFEYESDCEGVTIKKYIGSDSIVVIPDKIGGINVTYIADGAFEGKNIRALYMPDSVEYLANGVLQGCDSLVTLRLSGRCWSKEDFLGRIFGASAPDENAVTVPQSLDMFILGEGATEIAKDAFLGCKTLSAVVLPESVNSIGDAAFYECTDLVYVGIGSCANKIGEYAFAYCRALYSIDVSMASDIGSGVLFSCTALNSIKLNIADGDFLGKLFGASAPEYNADFIPVSLRRIDIAEGSVEIPDRMFSSCKYITEVTLPESIEKIGIRSFYACRSLSSIKMTSVKEVGDDAFFGCDGLREVDLGNSLESLGMQAFFGCEELKSISFPASLKEIKSSSFYGCLSLVSVDLGGVKKIGKDAFSGCVRVTPVSTFGIEVADGNESLIPGTEE